MEPHWKADTFFSALPPRVSECGFSGTQIFVDESRIQITGFREESGWSVIQGRAVRGEDASFFSGYEQKLYAY